jgi:uncharacterized FlaG/YvyC family protein
MEGKDLNVQAITSQASDASRAAKARPNEAEIARQDSAKKQVVDTQPVNQPKIEPLENIARIEQVEDRSLKIAVDSYSIDRIREKVAELEKALPKTSNSLSFSVDEVLNRPVITVIDRKSGEVVRTLPSEEVLRVVHNVDKMKGILFEDDF